MSTSFWLVIIIFVLFVSLFFGIGGFLLSHWFFKPSNNPNVARIYVEGISKPYIGRLKFTSRKGSVFIYNQDKVIFVPASYETRFHYYKRLLWLDSSKNLITLPQGDDKPATPNEKNELIEELVQSNIGASAIREIKERSSFSLVMIIVIVIIAIAAGVGGYALRRPTVITQPVAISQPTQSQPQPTITIEGSGQSK